MVPFDIQTLEKLDAAIQQVEAAIELFYAKRYAPAITLAGAAEGCLGLAPGGEDAAGDDEDIQDPEPLFELMKCGAMEQYGKTKKRGRRAVQRCARLAETRNARCAGAHGTNQL